MLKRLNEALPGLVLGIIIYGILLQITGIWLVNDKLRYSTGLWIGIGCALFMAIHMAISIEDAVCIGTEDGAKKKTIASAMFRYVIVLLVLVAMCYFNLGMILPAFFGVLGLKISAYVQPLFYRLRDRKKHKS
ncbi:MAG: hypothetical protein MR020_05895 [Lachnospiraceae bacterium]|nr:hypothetical protein [Lachnospiraceae bacterium]